MNKNYIILDIRSKPPEFLNAENKFVQGILNARFLSFEEGNKIMDEFTSIGNYLGNHRTSFLPGMAPKKEFGLLFTVSHNKSPLSYFLYLYMNCAANK